MRTLIMVRHGESEGGGSGLLDIDRPLTSAGEGQARVMGRALSTLGVDPNSVVISEADRALHTARLLHEGLDSDGEAEVHPGIYPAGPEDLLRIILDGASKSDPRCLMVVGHSHALEEAAGRLIGGFAAPTPCIDLEHSGALRIDFDRPSWADVEVGDGKLVWLLTPDVASAIVDLHP